MSNQPVLEKNGSRLKKVYQRYYFYVLKDTKTGLKYAGYRTIRSKSPLTTHNFLSKYRFALHSGPTKAYRFLAKCKENQTLICDHLEIFDTLDEAKYREYQVISGFRGSDWKEYLNKQIPVYQRLVSPTGRENPSQPETPQEIKINLKITLEIQGLKNEQAKVEVESPANSLPCSSVGDL